MMYFLFFAVALAGFGGKISFKAPRAHKGRPCGTQEALFLSNSYINPKCSFHFGNWTFPMSHKLNPQLFSALLYPEVYPKPHVHVSYNLRWSGSKAISREEYCYEDEKCRLSITPCDIHSWCVQLQKEDFGTAEPTSLKSSNSNHLIIFQGPKKAVVFANLILNELSWLDNNTSLNWCLFCKPNIERLLLPAVYKNLPVGILTVRFESIENPFVE
ncbi:hypothetical protein DSO57_1009908 [Entomophthora muscae]|uniref:Uncharacterized protein n=1 Tax=Entomophthora muscae TaxID=34485 RepID=A0ACC2U662_9FUNG|nr:hypothetical protein DSO57_1009908 [Entomophthora muscae]